MKYIWKTQKKREVKPMIIGMALYQPGAFAPIISGSVGGTVFSHNSGGSYIKNKAIPLNPDTTYQVAARSLLATYAAAWKTLSSAQQLQWNAFATANPVVNRIGQTVTLSGFNMYCRLSINCFNVGTTSPPSSPPVADSFTVVSPATVAVTCIAGAISFAFTPTPVPASTAYMVFASPPLSTGKLFVKSQLRFFHVIVAAVATPVVLTTFYTARFGAPPLGAGAKITFEIVAVNTINGYQGIPQKVQTLTS